MSDLREELAAALGSVLDWEAPQPSLLPSSSEEIVDALLPVVRRYAARELREAAAIVAHTPGIKHQASALNAIHLRADALIADVP